MAPVHAADEVLIGFTHALRAAGLTVSTARARSYLEAANVLGATALELRRAGRVTLCSSPEDLEIHDAVFDLYFGGARTAPQAAPSDPHEASPSPFAASDVHSDADSMAPEAPILVQATTTEVLRRRDLADLPLPERHRVNQLIGDLNPRSPVRRTARRKAHRSGEVDANATLRATLRRLGEPSRIEYRRADLRPRRIVLVVDVSGSMSSYADAILRLAHRMTQALPGPVETYAIGTRTTSITQQLRHRQVDRALTAVSATIPDWSGGTRLGENFESLLADRATRQLMRGAVVVVFSDGWEAGDVTQLQMQVRRLQLLAHQTVWVSPHQGKPGYEPLQRGVVALLPHVDHFVAGHSVTAFDSLLNLVSDS